MTEVMEETPEQVEWRLRHERLEQLTEERAEGLRSELEQQWPGGRMLAERVSGGTVRMIYGVEVYSGSTPQSERWVAVELTASFSSWSEEMSYMELSPERVTRTGRRVRGGFYSPDVNLSIDSYIDEVRGGSITCSSGPALNGGEGPGRMAMFSGCLQIAERVLGAIHPDSL